MYNDSRYIKVDLIELANDLDIRHMRKKEWRM